MANLIYELQSTLYRFPLTDDVFHDGYVAGAPGEIHNSVQWQEYLAPEQRSRTGLLLQMSGSRSKMKSKSDTGQQ